jgi:cyclophilin family peptidyl-prolyl cis-trans isomerase
MAAPRVVIRTNHGELTLELDPVKAPKTVENFLQYVADHHYDGTIFHRVIPGFMAQGGGYDARYEKRPVRAPVQNEADNGLRNLRGSVAMARTGEPHSATAQFFVNLVDNAFLDHRGKTDSGWGYTVFGKVVAGMEVVDRVATLPTKAAGPFGKDVPSEAVVIESARLAP